MKRILNYIKHLVYKRKELKRLKLCLEVIKKAKIYQELYKEGMCASFKYAIIYTESIRNIPEWLNKNIPEFNAKYLTGLDVSHSDYWWHICDTSSRIAAFDKLINLYKTKIKELC